MNKREFSKLLRAATKNPDSWHKDHSDGELFYAPANISLWPMPIWLRVRDRRGEIPAFKLSLYTSLYIRFKVGWTIRKRTKDNRLKELEDACTTYCNRLLGNRK